MTDTFDIGDNRRFSATFKDIDGVLIDPTTVTFKAALPDGTTAIWVYLTDAQIVRDSLGVFHADYLFQQAGRYVLQWKATGTIETMEQLEIYIRRSN